MFALSEPGKLEDALASAGLNPYEDEEIECPIVFADAEAAERAFLGAGQRSWRSVTRAKRQSPRRCARRWAVH